MPKQNDEPWGLLFFCILHVQEHDVNTSVLQQETEDKSWWSLSSSWELSATVFVYVVLYKAEVTDTNNPFWQLQPYFCFPNSFRWLPVYLLFLNACLILRRMCVYKCCTICSLGCTATAWKFSTGWQRGMKKKMKSDVLVIIARHSKIYFWRSYLSWRFICLLYNCQMTMQILAVTWQQMTFPPHIWKWSEI